MTADSMITELVSCYVTPTKKMIEKMQYIAESIPDDARQDVVDSIIEEEGPSTKIGTSHIVAACVKLGVPFRRTTYVQAEDWICDGCGHKFKYTPAPSDDDKIDKGLYDVCPMCSMQVNWTLAVNRARKLGHDTTWYDRALRDCADWGPNKPEVVRKIFNLTLKRGGVYWSRSRAEGERREEKKIAIDVRMSEIDRAKRWDLEKGDV